MSSSLQETNRMVSKLALDTLKKADELKEKSMNAQCSIQNIEIWATQQQLLKIYRDVLIYDLEYALDQKVEQDLWTYGFKNYIVALQNMAKDKKDNWNVFQARLSSFLDAASGYYFSLLQDICNLFGLDLPFKRHDKLYGYGNQQNENGTLHRPERSSCHYICQHCLVHLGDIARYRNQVIQAEAFYRHALALGANSGHPYNQLALLEASRADRLSTVFYYTRSIAVAHKFPAALTNLANTLNKGANKPLSLEGKVSSSDYEAAFLRIIALLYMSQDVAGANNVLQSIAHSLTPLIATHEFSSWKLIQMAVISIFTYTQAEEKQSEVCHVLSEFLIGFFSALLLPLYTMSGENVLDYFSLPTIKVLMSWLKCDPGIIEELNRTHLWRGLCKLLNILRAMPMAISPSFINSALPEDIDLKGFLPLEPLLSGLNYSSDDLPADSIKALRANRIIKLGEWLALYSDYKPITINGENLFETKPITPTPTTEETNLKSQLASGMPSQDSLKGRSRQNVALQSIFRRSQYQGNEVGLDTGWQPNKAPPDTRWWPQGNVGEVTPAWNMTNVDLSNSSQEGTYSLFSDSPEVRPMTSSSSSIASSGNLTLSHQSLWSGPGPSPLERLLEQQKQLRHSSHFNT